MKPTMWTKSSDTINPAAQESGVTFAAINYHSLRERIRAEDPKIDEQTLADTVEGLTNLHEIIAAIIRAALADEALATGSRAASPRCRIASSVCRIVLRSAGR
jgi:hypothetical protein